MHFLTRFRVHKPYLIHTPNVQRICCRCHQTLAFRDEWYTFGGAVKLCKKIVLIFPFLTNTRMRIIGTFPGRDYLLLTVAPMTANVSTSSPARTYNTFSRKTTSKNIIVIPKIFFCF